eukprot:11900410-Ditylum_brightwellii.AAC.1
MYTDEKGIWTIEITKEDLQLAMQDISLDLEVLQTVLPDEFFTKNPAFPVPRIMHKNLWINKRCWLHHPGLDMGQALILCATSSSQKDVLLQDEEKRNSMTSYFARLLLTSAKVSYGGYEKGSLLLSILVWSVEAGPGKSTRGV